MSHTNIKERLVFVDVGAHRGQTIDEVLRDRWAFDHVYAFEPHPAFFADLKARYADAVEAGRLTLFEAGLADRDGAAPLYGDNAGGGASLMRKKGADGGDGRTVRLLDTADFIAKHARAGDRFYIKLNCEGAETLVVRRLMMLDDELLARVAEIMIDFDVVKTRGGLWRKRAALGAMRARGFDRYRLAEAVMVGPSHGERIANWLLHRPELRRAELRDAFADESIQRQRLHRRVKYAVRDLLAAI